MMALSSFETVQLLVSLTDHRSFSSLQRRWSRASSFYVSLIKAIDGVMFLALCPQLVSLVQAIDRWCDVLALCTQVVSLLRVIDDVMSLALCPQVVSLLQAIDGLMSLTL